MHWEILDSLINRWAMREDESSFAAIENPSRRKLERINNRCSNR
jgi:hypothetical protein